MVLIKNRFAILGILLILSCNRGKDEFIGCIDEGIKKNCNPTKINLKQKCNLDFDKVFIFYAGVLSQEISKTIDIKVEDKEIASEHQRVIFVKQKIIVQDIITDNSKLTFYSLDSVPILGGQKLTKAIWSNNINPSISCEVTSYGSRHYFIDFSIKSN